MSSVNKVILLGNLGADPDLRQVGDGQSRCTLSIATNRRYQDRDGQRQEKVTWHRVVVWGKQAENCHAYLSKGRSVYVEGRLDSRSYTDKEGQKRYVTEVVARVVQFLGGGRAESGSNGHRATPQGAGAYEEDQPMGDLPF